VPAAQTLTEAADAASPDHDRHAICLTVRDPRSWCRTEVALLATGRGRSRSSCGLGFEQNATRTSS
jgi:hypothetical protein